MTSQSQESNTRIEFRDKLRPTDVPAIRSIVEATGMFSAEEADVAAELAEESLQRGDSSGYRFVIAESAGSVVGYACFGPIPCTRSSFDLYWIAVDPHSQRLGLGRRIIGQVESRVGSVGGTRIYVDTAGRDEYIPTRAFYERMGYVCAAVLPDFYAPADAKVIYAKVL